MLIALLKILVVDLGVALFKTLLEHLTRAKVITRRRNAKRNPV